MSELPHLIRTRLISNEILEWLREFIGEDHYSIDSHEHAITGHPIMDGYRFQSKNDALLFIVTWK